LSKKLKLYKQRREFFSDPNLALDEGVVAISEEIDTELLFEAYSFGIFPWPHNEGAPLLWFCPSQRGILEFSDLHIARSLDKAWRNCSYSFSFNKAFDLVVEKCAFAGRPNQSGTWITPQMRKAYNRFHQQGYAHSIECWEGESLIGGIYGVYVAGLFSGESMFYTKPNASKFCLLQLIQSLQANGLSWMDIQMLTPHMEVMGAKTIRRKKFLDKLTQAKRQARPLVLEPNPRVFG